VLRGFEAKVFVFFRRFGGQGRMIYAEASPTPKTFLASKEGPGSNNLTEEAETKRPPRRWGGFLFS